MQYPTTPKTLSITLLIALAFTFSCKKKPETKPITNEVNILQDDEKEQLTIALGDGLRKFEESLEKTKDPEAAELRAIEILSQTNPEIKAEYDRLQQSSIYQEIMKNQAQVATLQSAVKISDLVQPMARVADNASLTDREKTKINTLNEILKQAGDQYINRLYQDTAKTEVEVDVTELETIYKKEIEDFERELVSDNSLNDNERKNVAIHIEMLRQNLPKVTEQIDKATDELGFINQRINGFGSKIKKFFKSLFKRVIPVVIAVGAGIITGGLAFFAAKAFLCTCVGQFLIKVLGKYTPAALAAIFGRKIQSLVQGNVYCLIVKKDCDQCNKKDFAGSINNCLFPPSIVNFLDKANKILKIFGLGQINVGAWIDKTFSIENLSKYTVKVDSLSLAIRSGSAAGLAGANIVVDASEFGKYTGTVLKPGEKIEDISFRIRANEPGAVLAKITVHSEQNLSQGDSDTTFKSNSIDVTAQALDFSNSLNQGLVLHLTMDSLEKDNTGSVTFVRDFSGYGNHGLVVGTPEVVESKSGGSDKAIAFSSDKFMVSQKPEDLAYLLVPGTDERLSGFKNMTISTWVYIEKASPFGDGTSGVVSKDFQFVGSGNYMDQNTYILATQGTTLRAGTNRYYQGQLTDNGANMKLKQWHHLVFVHQGIKGGKLYVDGQLVKEVNITGNLVLSTNPILIGMDSNRGNIFRPFEGYIDDVRIYNRAMAEDEIQKLLNEK